MKKRNAPSPDSTRALREVVGGIRYREARIESSSADGGVVVALSSEAVVDYGWYKEVLRHEPGCIEMTRAKLGLSYLADHDRKRLVGRLDKVALEKDRILRGTGRYATNPCALEVRADIEANVRPGGSIGYNILEWHEEKREDGLYLVADLWEPLEYSSVTIEADLAAGAGRQKPTRTEPDEDDAEETEEIDNEESNRGTHTEPPAEPGRSQEPPMLKTKEQLAAEAEASRAASAAAAGNSPPDPARELVAFAARQKVSTERLSKWLENGTTLDAAKDEILAEVTARGAANPMPQPDAESLDMTERDAGKYSYRKAMAIALGITKERSGFEVDVAQELAGKMPVTFSRKGGMLIPLRLRKSPQPGERFNPLNTQTAGAGAELVYAQYGGEVIELLRNMAATTRMGARLLSGLSSPISFPTQTGAASSTWIGENPAAPVAESEATFGHKMLSPKTLQAKSFISRQLLIETTPDVETMVREDLALVHALAWDLAALHGLSTANQPTGIYNITGVATEAFGGAPTYAHLLNMAKKIATANAMLGTLGFLTNPQFASESSGILRFAVNGSKQLWEGPILEGNMIDYKAIATNQVSATMSGLAASGGTELGCIFGNWRDLIIGQFGGAVEILVDPYTAADSGLIRYISFQMVDILARHAASFCVATGAT